MPVVARNIQILSGIFFVGAFPATVLFGLLCFVCGTGLAQEQLGAENVGIAVCLEKIQEQQKLTRDIRDIRNPLPRPENADKLKREYSRLLAAGFSSPAETKVIQDYLAWNILQATDPNFAQSSKNMQNLIDDVQDDVARAATGIGNPANQATARKKYCAEVLKVTKQLLDNNLDSRLMAVRLMQVLYDVMGVQNGAKARLHPEALVTLLSVLNDPKQPDSVKVGTVSSIRNIMMNCDVVEQDQFRICDAIGKELSRPCTEAGFQLVLIDAVYEISKARRTVGAAEPTAFKLLAAVINDRSKPIEVRCHAARGIGRGAFDQQMKLDPLAWKITQLAGDAALEFSKDTGNPKWPECGIDLLLAFRHLSAPEATGAVLERKGLMNRDEKSTVIKEAAPFITTVSLKLIGNKGNFTVQELTPLAQWIKANQPASLSWDSNAPALSP